VDISRCRRAETDAALVVSSYLDTRYPFTAPEDSGYVHQALRQAYVSARLADVPVALTRESDGIARGARLYLVPSVKQLLAPSWSQLEQLADRGATVYVSYSPGATAWHRGPSYGSLNASFGVEHELRAGLVDVIEDDTVTFTFQRDFGTLVRGSQLAFRPAGNDHSRAYLPVRPVSAEVLATDGRGRPALLMRRVGTGSMVLCTYPIEHIAASTPRVNPEATSQLYSALAAQAGVRRLIQVDDPRIAADVLVRSDGAQFAWLVSQADEAATVKPQLADGLSASPVDGKADSDAGDDGVTIAPFGVRVLRLQDDLTGS
jgi:hypothetical protein